MSRDADFDLLAAAGAHLLSKSLSQILKPKYDISAKGLKAVAKAFKRERASVLGNKKASVSKTRLG